MATQDQAYAQPPDPNQPPVVVVQQQGSGGGGGGGGAGIMADFTDKKQTILAILCIAGVVRFFFHTPNIWEGKN